MKKIFILGLTLMLVLTFDRSFSSDDWGSGDTNWGSPSPYRQSVQSSLSGNWLIICELHEYDGKRITKNEVMIQKSNIDYFNFWGEDLRVLILHFGDSTYRIECVLEQECQQIKQLIMR